MGARQQDEHGATNIVIITSTANTALTEVKATFRPTEEVERARLKSRTDPSPTHTSAQAEAGRARVCCIRSTVWQMATDTLFGGQAKHLDLRTFSPLRQACSSWVLTPCVLTL